MRKVVIVLLLVFNNIYCQNTNDEIVGAIQFTEENEDVNSLYKEKNQNFDGSSVTILETFLIYHDTLKASENKIFFLHKDPDRSIAYFPKKQRLQFYLTHNNRILKDFRKGRVSRYPLDGQISLLYNSALSFAKERGLLEPHLGIGYFKKSNNLEVTTKPIFFNFSKNVYFNEKLEEFTSLGEAIKSYFPKHEDYLKYIRNAPPSIIIN